MAEYNPDLPPVSLQEVIAASGKQLSTNDYTNEDAAKVAAIATVADLVAVGEVKNIIGSGAVGVWDQTTQDRIAALVAQGWPLENIIISYTAASGETGTLTADGATVTSAVSVAELTGELLATSASAAPSVGVAGLSGSLLVDNAAVTPAVDAASLVGTLVAASASMIPAVAASSLTGTLAAENVMVTPAASDAPLLAEGYVSADPVSVTPTISEAALIGELAADSVSVAPQLAAAEAVGVLLTDNVSATPQIINAELTEAASLVAADNVSVTPAIGTALLTGVLAANNVSVTPNIGAANLTEPGSAVNVTDDFNRANSADLGSNWADVGISNTGVVSNQASGDGTNRWAGPESFSANQYSQVKGNGYAWVRLATNGDVTGYFGKYDFDESESVNYYGIYKVIDDVLEVLAEVVVTATFNYLRLEVVDSTLTLKHSLNGADWTTFGSEPDSAITTGAPGFGLAGVTIDEFKGGDL